MPKIISGENSKCPYCGDAPTHHALLYANSAVSLVIEPVLGTFSKHIPGIFKRLAELMLDGLFRLCVRCGFVRFSGEMEKASTLRSKVIWQEAERRSILMEQAIAFGRPTDHYRTRINGKNFYFESLPLASGDKKKSEHPWDDKFFLKKILMPLGVPVPRFHRLAHFEKARASGIFDRLSKPIIVKPAVGSRGRHTTTKIHTEEDFRRAVSRAFAVSPVLVAEEHLEGYVCRATFVGGELVGFYRGEPPLVMGDGKQTIAELVREKNNNRPESVSEIVFSTEVLEYLRRAGYTAEDILPEGEKLYLTHRTGRYFGGRTREMLSALHPSFRPILQKAANATGLPVLGFDCIIPDPEAPAEEQRWGVIECNTLPFIDLHYFAFEGEREKNIAGMVWDLYLKDAA